MIHGKLLQKYWFGGDFIVLCWNSHFNCFSYLYKYDRKEFKVDSKTKYYGHRTFKGITG